MKRASWYDEAGRSPLAMVASTTYRTLSTPPFLTGKVDWQEHFSLDPVAEFKPQERRELGRTTRRRQETKAFDVLQTGMEWLLFLSSVCQLVRLWPVVGRWRKWGRQSPENEQRTETLERSTVVREMKGTELTCLVWRPSLARGAFVLLPCLNPTCLVVYWETSSVILPTGHIGSTAIEQVYSETHNERYTWLKSILFIFLRKREW